MSQAAEILLGPVGGADGVGLVGLDKGHQARAHRIKGDPCLAAEYADGAFCVRYYDSILPIAPDSYGLVLGHRMEAVVEALGENHEHVQELQSILTALSHLPGFADELTPDQIAERGREKEIIKRRGRIVCLPQAVTTSPRRYRARGALRTMLRNWVAAGGWWLGLPRERIAAWYRR